MTRYNNGTLTPWGDRTWSSGDALSGWEKFYGYSGQYKPGEQVVAPTVADAYVTGFGPGDLRRATNRGYSATAIMNYLSGQDGGGGYGGIIPMEVKNQLRQRMAVEEGMYHGWNKYKDKFSAIQDQFKDYTKTADQQQVDLSDYAKTSDVQANTQNIQKAMLEAQKVRQNNPYAVQGNTAMGIQQKQSPSQVAGQISAGLAGLSRNQKDFKNKTLNI